MAEEKMKILYLMKILLEDTDKDHILNASELCERMQSRYSLPCNRKTIYSDMERLRTFGINVEQVKGDRQGYYVSERAFSLPELKLLVDAVQSSKFITKTRSEELIRKLGKLTSRESARKLQRQVFIINRTKTVNESALLSVDLIHGAMSDNRQIRFRYCEWNVKKELVPRRNGVIYEISPWALTWDDENYYLVGMRRVPTGSSIIVSTRCRIWRSVKRGVPARRSSRILTWRHFPERRSVCSAGRIQM